MKKLPLILAFLLALLSCSDDDNFTAANWHILTMPVDTLSMDTVFSKVPAPTKSFWVFNHSGKNIRCSNVKLEKGNQTGFRVNVDGEFLGAERGYQVADVEIRNGDSIRIFVEVTAPLQGKDAPSLVEDNLLFNLESGIQQKINLNAWSWDAETMRNVVVQGNQTIDGTNKPIIIYGGIKIDSLATLTITPGSTLFFHDGAGIDVYGTLKSIGTPDANITLRGDRLDRMFDYLPYDLVSGQWKGIHLHESSYDNELTFTDIHSTYDGIVCDSSDVERRKLTLAYSTVHNCQGYGLLALNSNVQILGSLLSNSQNPCLEVCGGKMSATHCTFAQFYPFDFSCGLAMSFSNGENRPLLDFSVKNCIVTGYADDVIMGERADTTQAFNYLFANSVLRTPEVVDTLSMILNIFETASDTIIGGEKHFALISAATQHYDFHLDSLSCAIGAANPEFQLPFDRDGNSFNSERPSAGCFEWQRKEAVRSNKQRRVYKINN